jgi:hypothetical protein
MGLRAVGPFAAPGLVGLALLAASGAVARGSEAPAGQAPTPPGELSPAALSPQSPFGTQASTKTPAERARAVVVIVDDVGNVGLRIADAQQLTESVVSHLRKRLGEDAVLYEGAKKSMAALKRMLGPNSETPLQDDQIAVFDLAEQTAPFRAAIRFGKKKSQHFAEVTCRKRAEKQPVDVARGTGATFQAARAALVEELAAFCLQLPAPQPAAATPAGDAGGAGGGEGAGDPPGIRPKSK